MAKPKKDHIHKWVIPNFAIGDFLVMGSHAMCACGAFRKAVWRH